MIVLVCPRLPAICVLSQLGAFPVVLRIYPRLTALVAWASMFNVSRDMGAVPEGKL